MVATRLNPCTAYQILDRGGVDLSSKTTINCFDNLVKYNISAFLEHYELVTFLWHFSSRIAGLLR